MFETLPVFAAFGAIAIGMVSTEVWRLWSERAMVRAARGDDRLLAAIDAHEQQARVVRQRTAVTA